MSKKKKKAILVGAGQRGTFVFGNFALAHPDLLEFVAVIEPDEIRRQRFAKFHGLKEEVCFDDFSLLQNGNIEADAVIIATMDRLHVAPTLLALEAGYDVLLEKPMATNLSDCMLLTERAKKSGRLLAIAHVLRYTPYFLELKNIVSSGQLGDIASISHFENVSYWHMAHSFIRGNWSREDSSGPMLLTKCCHDLDLLLWIMEHKKAISVFSRGTRSHFIKEKAPQDAKSRCIDDCPAEPQCPYSAPRFYLDMEKDPYFAHAITDDITYEGRLRALRSGPYGECVYTSDKDIVDHQSVIIEFEDGSLATLVMHGLSQEEGRTMRYDGSLATLRGKFPHGGGHELQIQNHLSNESKLIHPPVSGWGGHGGGDGGLIKSFLEALDDRSVKHSICDVESALSSHIIAFAAEVSRRTGNLVNLEDFKKSVSLIKSEED